MPGVYANSLLTVPAAATGDAHEWFLNINLMY